MSALTPIPAAAAAQESTLEARPVILGANGAGLSPHSVIEGDAAEKSQRRRPWTTKEVARLKAVYPAGGLPAALQALPGRSAGSIYQKADKLGLRSPRQAAPRRANYVWAPHHDDLIRRKLGEARRGRGVWRELEQALARPRQVIRGRALALGLCVPRAKPLPWSAEEDAILRTAVGKGTRQAQRLLRRAGYQRTETAIKLRQMQVAGTTALERPEGVVTGRGLAEMLGVDSKTVSAWIAEGLLKAKRRTDREWWIKERDVRAFIVAHPARLHLGKVEAAGGRYWLIALLAGD